MRRGVSQSVRHHSRPSLALGASDLGLLRENNESDEDILRRQLVDKDREVDKLHTQVQLLQAQLAQRPPVEEVQELRKEYKNLEILLQGTQRENERCMADLVRQKEREKMLERELAKLAGENWQSSLDITPPPPRMPHQRTGTMSSMSSGRSSTPPAKANGKDHQQNTAAALAQIEQVRLLILGMEQRLQTREEKLIKTVERAESECVRFDELKKAAAKADGIA